MSLFSYPGAFALECGVKLPGFDLKYETWGSLNKQADNAILVCHALTGSSHAAVSREDTSPGWWNELIGPGKALDTNKYFVVCHSNIGSVVGSTGPLSNNPETQAPYGDNFPSVTVLDWVNTQKQLQEHLGIEVWKAVVGGSLGGMQALEWTRAYPQSLEACVIIASTMKLSLQNRAFSHIALEGMKRSKSAMDGLAMARMLGHITYLSTDLEDKFKSQDSHQVVENYLNHQGAKFAANSGFTPYAYSLLVNALNDYDAWGGSSESFAKSVNDFQGRYLVMSFTSDWRFSTERSREMVAALVQANKPVSFLELEDSRGHDSFLFVSKRYEQAVKNFLLQDQILAKSPS